MSEMELIVNITEGNPGCLNFLMNLATHPKGMEAIKTLKKYGITGSRAYQLWNDCCGGNTREAAEIIGYLEDGRISAEEMRDHVFQPWGKAFDMDELRQRKPVKS